MLQINLCRILGKIKKSDLELMEKQEKTIKVPFNLGQILYKIATDQWKLFMMIYVTPIMWNLLDRDDWQILANFVRACYLLINRIIDKDLLNKA